MVYFRPRFSQLEGEGEIEMLLNKKMLYEQVVEKLAERLQIPPTHLRLSTINPVSGYYRSSIKRVPNQTLGAILHPQYLQIPSNILLYEVLDMSLSELEMRKNIKFVWVYDGNSKSEAVEALIPKNGVTGDIVPLLQKKFSLADDVARRIRFYEVHNHKIYKEVDLEYSVAGLQDYIELFAEEMPEEELNRLPEDKFVNCFHFFKEPSRSHSIPFKFVVQKNEVFKDTRERLAKRIEGKPADFNKIRFAIVSVQTYSRPTYVEDDTVLYDEIGEGDLLGLDHPDRAGYANRNGGERAIFIKR